MCYTEIVLFLPERLRQTLESPVIFMQLTTEEQIFFHRLLKDVAEHTDLLQMDSFLQHGDTSTLWHSIAVAYYSFLIARRLKLSCRWKSLVAGALLHDYYLYDWHIPAPDHRLHGFTHPKAALKNACRDWKVDKIQKNIIAHHMFPLTPVPPHYREGILVCLVDKWCSLAETFRSHCYKRLHKLYGSLLRKGGVPC